MRELPKGKEMKLIDKIFSKLKHDGLRTTFLAVLRYPFYRKRRLEYNEMLTLGSIEERFSEIYAKNFWSSKESGSGEGSELEYTVPLRTWMVDAFPKYQIKKMVDAPCGDFNWMKFAVPHLNIEYFGFDIVESVIKENKKNYGSKNIHFEVANICEDNLQECDILMVRDCLFHLSYEDINQFLENLTRVNYKYLLTTTHLVDKDFVNSDITTGDFRFINLFIKPFNFKNKDIIERVDDYPKGYSRPRQMILLAKSSVPKKLTNSL